jgi:predicted RNA-binding Zn-ribbon protein involved in translation (DUF1610 family)
MDGIVESRCLMAISVACPSCERELKVKDELAGRKVKCPGCGEAVTIPASEEEEEPAVKKRRSEEEDEDDRPRKKKKKKQSNQMLILGVIAGVALLGLCAVGSIGSYFLFFREKEKPKTTEQAKGGAPAGPTAKEQPRPTSGGQPKNVVVRGMELQEVKNAMKQLGLAYHNYHDTFRKGPPDREALSKFYENSVTINNLLKDGTVVFIWNVGILQMTQGTSNTILAYEKDSYKGLRVVLFGDGTVEMLDDAEFNAKPKAK